MSVGMLNLSESTGVTAVASEVAFTFARNSSYSTQQTLIPLPGEVVNPERRYRDSTFYTTLEGTHFVEVCVGIPSGRTSLVSPRSSTAFVRLAYL